MDFVETSDLPTGFLLVTALSSGLIGAGFWFADQKGWLQPPGSSRPPAGFRRALALSAVMFGIIAVLGVALGAGASGENLGRTNNVVAIAAGGLFLGAIPVWAVVARRHHRRFGTVPPPPHFEDPERPLPGWEWDGTRWRRRRD